MASQCHAKLASLSARHEFAWSYIQNDDIQSREKVKVETTLREGAGGGEVGWGSHGRYTAGCTWTRVHQVRCAHTGRMMIAIAWDLTHTK